MKSFLFDAALTNTLDVARRDNIEYLTDKILEKTENKFLVSWLGYAQKHNSWQPYKALRDFEQLHGYLTGHKIRFLIKIYEVTTQFRILLVFFSFLLLLSISVDVLEVFSQYKSAVTKLIFSRLQYVERI